jgi:N-acyl-phosphatidylethanolamine-hydrolysing phospholipase D
VLAAAMAVGAAVPDPPAFDAHAPHLKDGRFFNPWGPFDFGGFTRFLRWQLSTNTYDKGRPPVVPVVPNDGSSLARTLPPGEVEITWVGHATFAVHEGSDVFLTDPHFTSRALIPKRLHPPGIPIEAVPGDAFAVLSHNHYDHLDAGTAEALPPGVTWFVPLGMAEWFRGRGVHQVLELDWWEEARLGRWRITCLPSQHWSRRIEQGLNEALWCSWLVDSGDHRYYFAGDTGYFAGFEAFARAYPGIDVAMLPIGAYEPRWFMGVQHMDPAQAVQAFRDLRARHFLGMHWGTFDLTDEPLDEPPKELARVLREQGIDPAPYHVMAIGETLRLPRRVERAEAVPLGPPILAPYPAR